jgi:hypothetical protein
VTTSYSTQPSIAKPLQQRRSLTDRAAGRKSHCLGPTVPVSFNRDDLTQPDTVLPVLGFENITDDQPVFDCA